MISNDITRGQWIGIGKVSRSINMSLFWSPIAMSYHTLYVMLQKINTKCTLIKIIDTRYPSQVLHHHFDNACHPVGVKPFSQTLLIYHLISMVSCQKGPICHAYAWQIGSFWQDALAIRTHQMIHIGISSIIPILQLKYVHWLNGPWEMW